MEKAFLDMAMRARELTLNIGTLAAVKKAFDRLENYWNAASDAERARLRTIHTEEIFRIKNSLLAFARQSPVARSVHDRFSNVVGAQGPLGASVTRKFEKLVAGITYFKGETDGSMPVYHRFASCGKIGTHDTLVCLEQLPRRERQARGYRVEKCFIERLVYDKLYTNESLAFEKHPEQGESMQDEAHIRYLDSIRKEFQRCFKGYDVYVEIVYNKDVVPHWPCGVVIKRFKNGKLDTAEEHIRTIKDLDTKEYDDIVVSTKHDLARGKLYKTVQTFDADHKWVAVKKGGDIGI